jgi:hypothetical protein
VNQTVKFLYSRSNNNGSMIQALLVECLSSSYSRACVTKYWQGGWTSKRNMCSEEAFLPFQLFLRGVRTKNLCFCDLSTGFSSSIDDFAVRSQAGVVIWLTSQVGLRSLPCQLFLRSVRTKNLYFSVIYPQGFHDPLSTISRFDHKLEWQSG